MRKKRERRREREVDECQINLFAYKHLQYIDVFIFKFLKKMKHTNGRKEYCSNSMHISWLDSLRAIVVLFFSSFALCQTHSFLMEFQNASQIVKETDRERERESVSDDAARTHTYTLTNIFIILSHFFLLFFLLYAFTIITIFLFHSLQQSTC